MLLLRRGSQLAFHGGSWVFPGGRVDPEDREGAAGEDGAARAAAAREIQEESGLDVDPVSLVPFSHWTTPPGRARRFATWFFVAGAPDGYVVVDGGETSDHRWLTPAAALDAQRTGEVVLPPPTFVSLSRLALSATVSEALEEARRAPYLRFEPTVVAIDGGLGFAYPGDVAYGDPAAFDTPGPRHRLWGLDAGWRYEAPLVDPRP